MPGTSEGSYGASLQLWIALKYRIVASFGMAMPEGKGNIEFSPTAKQIRVKLETT